MSNEHTPQIVSRDPKARYVSQGSVYDRLATGETGPLTNRKILQYAREGRYGPEYKARVLASDKAKRRANTGRNPRETAAGSRRSLADLIGEYDQLLP